MATLTKLESKIAEVLGLAMASRIAAETVSDMLDDAHPDLADQLDQMRRDAAELQKRCTAVAGGFDRKKTAILTAARTTRDEAVDMMEAYLAEEEEALDGYEFLAMAESGEVVHWLVVARLNQRAQVAAVQALAEWALPIQQRHLAETLEAAVALAGVEDPAELEG